MLDNGLGLERWFERFIADSHAKRVELSKGVEPMEAMRASRRRRPSATSSPVHALLSYGSYRMRTEAGDTLGMMTFAPAMTAHGIVVVNSGAM